MADSRSGLGASRTVTVGEPVVREDGSPATVVALHVVPGAADYYNLTVSQLHTYAVGGGQYVVHNCGGGDSAPTGRNIVYRGLAADEDPEAGLTARAPNATNVDPVSHVAGKRLSPWISTTHDLNTAITRYGEHGVVAIDLDQIDTALVDVSEGIPGRDGQMISNWAAKAQEVLIFQRVPSKSIVWRSM